MALQFLWLVIGLALLVKGGELFVPAAVRIAEYSRMPRVVIGSTLVSLATTTPELVTAVLSSRSNTSDLAVRNVLGASIANLTSIVGTTAMMSKVTMRRATQMVNFPAMLVVFGLLLWVLLNDRRVSRKEGVALLVTYSLYHCARVFLAVALKQ